MIRINKEKFADVIALNKSEEEKQKVIEFIEDDRNNDFLEYILLSANGSYGFNSLSNGKTIWIDYPYSPTEEVTKAFKVLGERLKQTTKVLENYSYTYNDAPCSMSLLSCNIEHKGLSIEQLKKQIKYSKNPLEVKMLNKQLNKLYKEMRRK